MSPLPWFRAVQAPFAGARVSGAPERMWPRVGRVQRFAPLLLARLLGRERDRRSQRRAPMAAREVDRQSQRRAPKAAWEVVVPVSVVLTLPAPPRELRHSRARALVRP